ncbi:MAG: hypothetical protein ABF697_05345 [Zymomonas mobilis]|uniref:HNH endonuclease n=1 Tax=Zymomonas mobilis TaxID=542 RepID=UPI0039EC8BD7
MRKLSPPAFKSIELYDASVDELADATLKTKFLSNRNHIVQAFNDFDTVTRTKTWCNLPRIGHNNQNVIIVGTLSKSELTSLYANGVVKSKGQARFIYNTIRLSAHEECPYCGGIGDIGSDGELGTADHFLPKSRFPSYSVLPLNLVPACQVCNKEMGSDFPTLPEDQPLHPYLDNDHFFTEKWTTATVRDEEPIVVDFDVKPPTNWSEQDCSRVKKHFEICLLKSRYRSRVSQELTPLISQRKTTLKSLRSSEFKNHLMAVADEPNLPINGWKRTLYYALAETDWFLSKVF